MHRPAFTLVLLLALAQAANAQDYDWWNDTHDWDGISPWRSYLTLAPGYLGPNALPVPDLRNGRIDTVAYLDLAADAHFGSGDKTQNLYLRGHLPLFSDRVGLHLDYVPLEYYAMTPATRDERAARDFDGRGFASGDVYLGTHIQVLRDHPRLPDLLLAITLRTASGNKLTAARHTDTPGYYFDLSAGKTFPAGGALTGVRPHLMAGFYVWQTFADNHYQNDALLYGAGVDFRLRHLTLTPALAGYLSYLGEGDRPVVARLTLARRGHHRLGYFLRLQHGLTDFPYTSARLGFSWRRVGVGRRGAGAVLIRN